MAVHRKETLSLAATGDAILTRKLLPYEGQSSQFDQMLQLLRGTDVTVTNLEVLVHDYEVSPAANSGGTYMRAPPQILDELADMGLNLFSAATNHSFDYSHGGIRCTLAELQSRDLTFAGLGRNRFLAAQPGYLETSAGRVALLSACTSFTPGSEAGKRTGAVEGRPGLNPLYVEQLYQLRPEYIKDLKKVSNAAGIEEMKRSWLERGLYYNHDWNDPDYFHFDDMKFLPVNDEAKEGLHYKVNKDDLKALTDWIKEADANADFVVASIHSHQGADGHQNTAETPDFLVDVARCCIDAGADAFIGTGPHVLRGMELYNGKPVFYSLGNYIVQNETVARLPPESYRRYNLSAGSKVSDVFNSRLYSEDGEQKGDLANEAFWETVIPICEFDTDGTLETIELYPCTLQRNCSRPQRGIPVLATETEATTILEGFADLSSAFKTEVQIDGDTASVIC